MCLPRRIPNLIMLLVKLLIDRSSRNIRFNICVEGEHYLYFYVKDVNVNPLLPGTLSLCTRTSKFARTRK